MMLPVAALDNDAGGLDTARKTHIATRLWVRSRSVRFSASATFRMTTYSPGRRLIGTYARFVMNGRMQIEEITHRCKNFAKNRKNVASRENQEICGGVSKDFA